MCIGRGSSKALLKIPLSSALNAIGNLAFRAWRVQTNTSYTSWKLISTQWRSSSSSLCTLPPMQNALGQHHHSRTWSQAQMKGTLCSVYKGCRQYRLLLATAAVVVRKEADTSSDVVCPLPSPITPVSTESQAALLSTRLWPSCFVSRKMEIQSQASVQSRPSLWNLSCCCPLRMRT